MTLYRETPCEHGHAMDCFKPIEQRYDDRHSITYVCPGGTRSELTVDYEAAAKTLVWWTTETEWEDIDEIDPLISHQARAIVDAALGQP